MNDPNREAALFEALIKLAIEKREIFLDGACLGQPAMRARLEALLVAHDQTDDVLAVQPVPPPGTMKIELTDAPDEAIGQKIGHYKILEKVGEGGCGVVYVAEQTEPVRRRVALKVIKLGMDTRAVVARFEAERQALAMMDHPNIAKVFDAGATENGRPFFIMELVRGIRITDYCDQNNLPTQNRIDLFMKVCNAIQHAHQKGIIHRDIKPSNILVTLHDGIPVPKVIDFGIAKATEGRLTDATVYTQLHQFIGTPAYMSPEQAEMSGLDIDTRSDIYSLGVLLYELLTGRTPFDAQELMSHGIDAMRRIVREKEPLRPSTRLAALNADELTTTAKRRASEAPKLIHLLKGDLDWVIMKCLEKDRTRRYETANGLAFELKRHLNNEPVLARPPSTAYRLQKAVRRHKFAFLAVGAVCAVTFLGVTGTTIALLRAQHSERLASRSRNDAEKLSNFILEDFYNELEPSGQFGTVARLAKQALDYYDGLPASLRTQATLRNRAIAQSRLAWVTVHMGDIQAAKVLAEEAASHLENLRQQGDTNELTILALAAAINASGMCYQASGSSMGVSAGTSMGESMFKKAIEVLHPLVLSGKASSRARVEYANTLNLLGENQQAQEGLATCNEALSILADLGALSCSNLAAASAWAETADTQARKLLLLERVDEAERLEIQSLKLAEGVLERRPNDLRAIGVLYFAPDTLGLIETKRNHESAALDWFRRARVAAEKAVRYNPSDLGSRNNVNREDTLISAMLLRAGQVAQAVGTLQGGGTNFACEDGLNNCWLLLTLVESQRGNRTAAERALFEVSKNLECVARTLDQAQPLRKASALAAVYAERKLQLAFGENVAVLEVARETLPRVGELSKGEQQPDWIAWWNLVKRSVLSDSARAALRLERFGEAETFARSMQAVPILHSEWSDFLLVILPQDDVEWSQVLLAQALLGQGRKEDALKTLDPALALYREMRAEGVQHVDFVQRFTRALYVQALAQPSDSVGFAKRRDCLAEASKVLNELSEEAKQLHDSKEILGWLEAARKLETPPAKNLTP
jgi:serine/threonine protein kinase/tetratricopeptide (TPR) repeat protein